MVDIKMEGLILCFSRSGLPFNPLVNLRQNPKMPGTGRSPPHSPLNLNVDDDDYRLDVDTSKVINEAPSAQLLNLPEACDKFRILIIGRAAVGKSTICSKAFGISPEKVFSQVLPDRLSFFPRLLLCK